jgi:uncharacterized protein (DUF342 family)
MEDELSTSSENQLQPGKSIEKPFNELAYSDKNGKIVLTFLDNNLKVIGDFYPPEDDGLPITGDYIRGLLEEKNIVYGVRHDQIYDAYERCNNDYETVMDVLIASGDPPVDEEPEYLQLNPILVNPFQVWADEQEKNNGNTDYRSRTPFVIVKKDQALAKLRHMKPGQEGTNVHGEKIEFKVRRPTGITGGANTRMEGRFLISNIGGQLLMTKGVVSVNDSLVIKGPVGYSTGNIVFPGDIHIEGPVSDGFKIYSGGSVTIKQTFDVTDTVTKDDLTVAGGIIGRGKAKLKVGGTLRTKFIENCRVACRKNVEVDLEIINSQVYALESVEMGEKGHIVGGEIYAAKGVRTSNIGKKNGKAARIHCGVDFTLERERERGNNLLKAIALKIGRINDKMNDPDTDDGRREKLEALLKKLEEQRQKTQGRVVELLGRCNIYKDAVVEVRGEIVPGSIIKICQAALFVRTPLEKVRIRLDQDSGLLFTEKLV